jgi:hypothetical protein
MSGDPFSPDELRRMATFASEELGVGPRPDSHRDIFGYSLDLALLQHELTRFAEGQQSADPNRRNANDSQRIYSETYSLSLCRKVL